MGPFNPWSLTCLILEGSSITSASRLTLSNHESILARKKSASLQVYENHTIIEIIGDSPESA